VVIAILLFATFIHNHWPLKLISLVGLVVAAILLGYSIRYISIPQAFGLNITHQRFFYYCLLAIILGTAMGVATRLAYDLTLFPRGFTMLALVAPLIGAVEEIVFRGYIQGTLEEFGRYFSVLYATSTHTCYKLLVILTLSGPLQFDLFFLVLWTFLGGLLFGLLRMISKSSIPPIIAHGVFDIILYGGMATTPLWVWT
jgi:membrane protease YdiL (CAAX protease family)